jgi:hypothetical protein
VSLLPRATPAIGPAIASTIAALAARASIAARASLAARASIAVAVLALSAGTAQANGRFPAANQLILDPSDARHLVLRTTYGVLQTEDAGKTWTWICEEAVGFSGNFDPPIAPAAGGAILAGLSDGTRRSFDRGCTWEYATGAFAERFVVDLATDPLSPSRVVAIALDDGDAGDLKTIVAVSNDSGGSFELLPPGLPDGMIGATIEVVPGDPNRLYASGYQGSPTSTIVFHSEDRGATWQSTPIASRTGDIAYVSAVDPRNADRVYVRLDGPGQDSLLLSEDGARTFRTVLSVPGNMLGFALSPDGKRVIAGGPDAGLFLASGGDGVFTRVSDTHARCLMWSAAGLYACGTEHLDGFTVAVSSDEGKTFAPLHRLPDLSPRVCPEGTIAATKCPGAWPAVRAKIDPDGDAGNGDAAESDASTSPPSGSGSNCGCRVPHRRRGAESAIGAAVMIGIALARRLRSLRDRSRCT